MATIPSKSVTIQEVADRAQVSTKTVSRVINKEPGVNVDTYAHVLQVIKDLDYRPNLSARSLAGDRSFLIGLFIEHPGNYTTDLQTGALERCRESGLHLLIEPWNLDEPDLGYRVRAMLGQLRLEGVILVPPLCDHPVILEKLQEEGVPIVRLAPKDDRPTSPIVTMDGYAAAREMTRHLLDLGHRRIAFIRGSSGHRAAEDRYRGFLSEMAERGVTVDEELVRIGNFTFESGMECAQQILSLKRPATAIFASNDDMAAAVINVAQQMGLRLPRDLSVVGVDDTPFSRMIWPQLTTIRQPVKLMGWTAADLILEYAPKRRGWPDPMPMRMLPFDLVLRNSTARTNVGG